jgi:hypothetical protein
MPNPGGEVEHIPEHLLARRIAPDQERIGALGLLLQSALSGVRAVESLSARQEICLRAANYNEPQSEDKIRYEGSILSNRRNLGRGHKWPSPRNRFSRAEE